MGKIKFERATDAKGTVKIRYEGLPYAGPEVMEYVGNKNADVIAALIMLVCGFAIGDTDDEEAAKAVAKAITDGITRCMDGYFKEGKNEKD